MKAKAMTTVLVKLGRLDEDDGCYEYDLRMDVIGIYPFDADISPAIDFATDSIVVPAAVGMLNEYSLSQLKDVARKCYISAFREYIQEEWNMISPEEKLDIINYTALCEVLEPSMDSEEMIHKIIQTCEDERGLYVTLAHIYEYLPS